MKTETKCEDCGVSIKNPYIDESKVAEYEKDFSLKVETVDTVTLCDDCYKKFMKLMTRISQGN